MVSGSSGKNGTKQHKWRPSTKQVAMAALLLNPEDRRTKSEKMKEVGVPHRTFYRWMNDERYIEYIKSRLDRYIDAELADVWRALLAQCKRGNVQAIKLLFEVKQIHPNTKVLW